MDRDVRVVLAATLQIVHHHRRDAPGLRHAHVALESIRRSLVRGERTLTIDDHQLLFTTTSLFERIVRLLRRMQSAMAAHARG